VDARWLTSARQRLGLETGGKAAIRGDVEPTAAPACGRDTLGNMASTPTPQSRESHKKLKPKPKTEQKSWQTRNAARKEKQTAHAAKLAAETGDDTVSR
jgi:hypothetical protein